MSFCKNSSINTVLIDNQQNTFIMKETSSARITQLLTDQKAFFATCQTKDVAFRLKQLKRLKMAILEKQEEIEQALWKDLHKSPEEAYLTEISIVISEIEFHIKKLMRWSKPHHVSTPLHLLPSKSIIQYEPLGVALIVSPWNYPFQLIFNPLVGAISAGCCAILKPSPDTPTIAKLMEQIINELFEEHYIAIVQGEKETNTLLFNAKFDLIFFTGSPRLGKIVMRAAAENLTPVILELGGKSPCIVDKDADIKIAAKRIAWGKLINAGQTCIAPDYLFAHSEIKDALLAEIAANFKTMYGENPKESRFYPRIVNQRAFDRLSNMLQEGTIHTGGEIDRDERYIAPTVMENMSPDALVMKEEIFGPILPVLPFSSIEEPINYINADEKPLALYYFGKNKGAKKMLHQTSSGGACINDTLMHIANHKLPFGGVGQSGMGSYHGKVSFLAFSHQKAVVSSPTWIDIPLKYVPFKNFKLIKKLL